MDFDKQSVTLILILIICVFGLLGNFLCAIVIFGKSPKSPFYLLLIGLTFSDTLLLLKNLPNVLHQLGVLSLNASPRWLEITFYLADWISFSGTKYFTVAVSLERYFIICHPMRAQRAVTHGRAVAFTVGVFVIVVLISIWSYIYEKQLDKNETFQIYKAFILHVIPLFLVIILNILLCIGLKKFQRNRKNLTTSDTKEISVTKMLLAVVAVFAICSGVEFVRNIMAFAGYFDYTKYLWYDYNINCVSGILVALNSAVNFIIYCLMGATFLTELRKRLEVFPKWSQPLCGSRIEGNGRNGEASMDSGESNKSKESAISNSNTNT